MQIFLKTLSVKQHALPGKSRDLLRKANFFFLPATEEVHYKNLKPVAATLINHDKDIIKYTEQSGWCLEMNNKMKTGLWLSKNSWKTLWAELHFYHSVMNFLQTGSTQFEWCLMCSCIYSHPDYDSKKKRKKHTIQYVTEQSSPSSSRVHISCSLRPQNFEVLWGQISLRHHNQPGGESWGGDE